MLTHGLSGTHAYNSAAAHWYACNDPKHWKYKNYGGRGIKFGFQDKGSAAKWITENMGERPGPFYSIDRIDNDGPFAPGNLRWATRSEQRRNQRSGCTVQNMSFDEMKNEMRRRYREIGADVHFQIVPSP